MKKLFSIAIVLIVSTLLINAQDQPTEKDKIVHKTVIDLFQALADRDLVNLKHHCTEDILILENGVVWTLDTLVQKVNQNIAADYKRINSFEFIDTRITGTTAWTTYYNQAEVTRNGKNNIIRWLETAILIKEAGSWKIKTLHSTVRKA